jgi:hypothetical protein
MSRNSDGSGDEDEAHPDYGKWGCPDLLYQVVGYQAYYLSVLVTQG